MKDTKHIVITGPESSGKTELANYLSKEYDAIIVEEYAREYLEKYGPEYQRKDLKTIAFGQFSRQLSALSGETDLVISDTDLLTIDIWDQYKYGQSDDFILEWMGLQQVDLYLLCKPDLPWEYDILRESENNRDELFEIHVSRIEELSIPYQIIFGNFDEREKLALKYIEMFLKTV